MTTLAERGAAIPAPPRRRSPSLLWLLVTVVIIALHVVAAVKTEFSVSALVEGRHGMASFLDEAWPPDLSWSETIAPGLKAALATFSIGLLGTTLAVPVSLVLAVLGSRTTTPNRWVYQASRAVMSATRSVPSVIFALIFVTAVGLGPFPGVLALFVHSSGITAKLWAEAMDEVDLGPVEALQSVGATRLQVLIHAILPTVAPTFVGLVLYRLDVNVREALVLGLVGAGGLGFLINQSKALFRFDQMLTFIIIVLILVIAVDQLSAYIRKRLAV
jgi:phosphonate transport system permease protein